MASNLFLLLFFLVVSYAPFLAFSSEPLNPEVEALIAIRQGLVDPHGVLNNWDEDSVDPCSWAMVTCSAHNLVIGLGAPSQGLSGTLSGRIANLTNLEQVLLQNNNITGRLPPELGALPRLQTLDLSNNRFSGRVPDTLGRLSTLRYLRLNNNSLSGAFPSSLAKIPQLSFLDLSYNNLTGPVPHFPTRTFNVVGNPMICGSSSGSHAGNANAAECATVVAPVTVPFPLDSTPSSSSRAAAAAVGRSKGGGGAARLPIGVGTSLGASALVLLAVSCFLWRRRRRHRCLLSGPSSVLGILEKGRDVEDGGGGEVMARLGNVRQFGLRELHAATDGFSARNILGKGGFGDVYRGRLSDGTVVAVKRLKDPTASGEAQFRTEVEMISLAVHRHLLRLVGFCAAASGERLLVYPYMPNGSVASRLRAAAGLADEEADRGGDGEGIAVPARAVRPKDHPPRREGRERAAGRVPRGRRRRLRARQAARPRRLPRHHGGARHGGAHRAGVPLHGAVVGEDRRVRLRHPAARARHRPARARGRQGLRRHPAPEGRHARLGEEGAPREAA
ncbi:probable LRR receptor-like serine/threonine-protein kinase At4g30520 isoform X2 [Oryza sativa Japonica Group]|uniref:probable LRR receptor-like serine/threonine-protein kinase At4g30520 isoform X2 n=1 Tax=Oryza sativa subsp. japonica TaxID=39947 RepID=UPI000E1BA7FD|nr:probable LRR receptor-like serine/threonine-protein kinase At4g30520 isoform X2 [Oryza sativa Japonica Group]KAF2919889.1 hypothetical protein DAI22_08g169000 [Oryza sativa Japonica Group]